MEKDKKFLVVEEGTQLLNQQNQQSETEPMLDKFRLALEIIKKHNGDYRQGHSWDTIWFFGENHKENAQKAFDEVKDLIPAYSLRHADAWEDTHNKVEAHSCFNSR